MKKKKEVLLFGGRGTGRVREWAPHYVICRTIPLQLSNKYCYIGASFTCATPTLILYRGCEKGKRDEPPTNINPQHVTTNIFIA